MRTIYSKIVIHPLFYLFAFLAVLTAHFQTLLEFMLVIFVHECGHILMAVFLHWNIKKILILPFGGMVEFQEQLNRPIHEEFLIVLAGPFFQILLYQIYPTPFHYPLLFFNLLPIYPLDGSKILFLCWNIIGTYYRSYYVLFWISNLVIGIVFLFCPLFFKLLVGYLWFLNIKLYRNISSLFLRFLFERYQSTFPYYRIQTLMGKQVKKMKRSVYHFFFYQHTYHSEQERLREYFQRGTVKK